MLPRSANDGGWERVTALLTTAKLFQDAAQVISDGIVKEGERYSEREALERVLASFNCPRRLGNDEDNTRAFLMWESVRYAIEVLEELPFVQLMMSGHEVCKLVYKSDREIYLKDNFEWLEIHAN
jgi:hypothetical protein